MGLTAAEKRARNAAYQARWRAKREVLVRSHPEVTERALIAAAERCAGLSAEECASLADRLADRAMVHLRQSQELAALARRVRTGMDSAEG